jgi:N-acyl-D-amino-acid deacylase
MQFDIIIRGGTVVDGTGAPARVADVGIRGGRIAAVGSLAGAEAGRVIEAAGRIVAPGFIDVHSHSELARLGGESQFTGLLQGVTTELISPDGFSWAPLSPKRLQEEREYLQVFYGEPPVDWQWHSVADYLAIFNGRVPGNLVPQVPHHAIKVEVTGWETRPATGEEIDAMKPLVREWLDAGAVAMAVGLEYQPSSASSLEELVELSKVVAERGGLYVTHQRGYWGRVERGTRETFRVAKEANIPVHISHLAVEAHTAALLQEGLDDGVDLTLDLYPYSAACTHLLMMLPDWAQAGGYAVTMARLADPAERARMRAETAQRIAERGEIALSWVENGPEFEGHTLGELARKANMADVDFMFDLLSNHGGRVLAVYHWTSDIDSEGILRRTMRHPRYMACTDGIFPGSRPHPRGFGTFPRIVGHYVRNGVLTIEEAVRKISGYPAERFRLRDRGHLQPEMAADVVVFDPTSVADLATYENGRAAPVGIEHVLVNGQIALADGTPTGALAGRVLRGL